MHKSLLQTLSHKGFLLGVVCIIGALMRSGAMAGIPFLFALCEVEILVTKGDCRLQITASQSGGAELVAPHREQMVHTIKEGLFGQLSFHLEHLKTRRVLSDRSSLACVEPAWAKGEKQS